MTEQHAEDLYGPNPEGDAPHAPELVTDPGDSPSYAVLNPTPPSGAQQELREVLALAVFTGLPKDHTDAELVEALGNAASILWGMGYRKILQ